MASIRLDGVMKRFGATEIIRRLDLDIRDGEFFTFVGPSGCGKSTILNMIAGLEEVSEGSIYFDRLRVNDLSPRERDVAMVFQSYALYPHMTVFDNIAFPLRMRKEQHATIDREVKGVAALLGLEAMLGRRPGQLSGGERQRVALGRAIIRRPKVFLMDEPLSNLDARLRVATRGELKRLHMELGITTVYVTHDQAEALGLSDRIAVLQKGVVQQYGTPEATYLRPANMFVAGFMGTPAMNFIPAATLSSLLAVPGTRDIVGGIRPEDVTINAAREGGKAQVKVVLVEPAGSFNWVDVTWNGTTVKGVSKLEMRLKTGDQASIVLDPRRVLFFQAGSGKRIE